MNEEQLIVQLLSSSDDSRCLIYYVNQRSNHRSRGEPGDEATITYGFVHTAAESVGEKEQWVVALLDCTSSDLQEDGDAYQAAGEEKDSDTDR